MRHSDVTHYNSNPSQRVTTRNIIGKPERRSTRVRSASSRSRFLSRASADLGRGKGWTRPTVKTRQTRSYAICGSPSGSRRTSGRAERGLPHDRGARSPQANRSSARTLPILNRFRSSLPLATGPAVRQSIARRATRRRPRSSFVPARRVRVFRCRIDCRFSRHCEGGTSRLARRRRTPVSALGSFGRDAGPGRADLGGMINGSHSPRGL